MCGFSTGTHNTSIHLADAAAIGKIVVNFIHCTFGCWVKGACMSFAAVAVELNIYLHRIISR